MEPIKVIVRVRPLDEQTNLQNQGPETVQISPDCQEIHLETPLLKHGSKSSKYDFVLGPNSSQEDVYSHIKGCVDSVVKGYNGCILAYGQTGSGKTYSMFGKSPGSHQALKYGGIIPRCIHEIFSVSQRDRHHLTSYNVYVSFIQVYNEQVYDLFSDSKNYQPLTIHETWPSNSGDIKRGHSVKVKPCSIIVAGLSELKVRNVKECMTLLQMGIKNRNIRETSMNNASSRSHSIFQILVEQERKHLDPKNPHIVSSVTHSLCSKLSLVDLAGSERWNMYRDSHIEDSQIAELTNINSSLHTLGRCMAALVRQQKDLLHAEPKRREDHRTVIHIPYRDSKLTRLLQDSLGGNATTILLATINPSFTCIEETISTLRFADRTGQVFTQAQLNEKRVLRPQDGNVESLQKEVKRLQKILTQHGIKYEPPHQPSKGKKNKLLLDENITLKDPNPTGLPGHEKNVISAALQKDNSQDSGALDYSCDLMVKAVSDVVHCCEIFLSTAASLKSTAADDNGPVLAISSRTSSLETKGSQNSNYGTGTTERSNSRLSQLLMRRKQLTRSSSTRIQINVPTDNSTSDENFKREEGRIRMELKEAHERKQKKTQLCTWLMEKEASCDRNTAVEELNEHQSSTLEPLKKGNGIRSRSLEACYHVVQQQLDELNESFETSHLTESSK